MRNIASFEKKLNRNIYGIFTQLKLFYKFYSVIDSFIFKNIFKFYLI